MIFCFANIFLTQPSIYHLKCSGMSRQKTKILFSDLVGSDCMACMDYKGLALLFSVRKMLLKLISHSQNDK